jgi:hypothetical protein
LRCTASAFFQSIGSAAGTSRTARETKENMVLFLW